MTFSGATLSGTPTESGTFSITVTGTDTNGCAGSQTYALTINAPSGSAPTLLSATVEDNARVTLSWTGVAGADHYEIARGVMPAAIGTASANTYLDMTVVAGSTYVYRVRAIGPDGVAGGYSNAQVATIVRFTDDPIIGGSTVIKAVHVMELRAAVNAVRAAAGLGAFTFTDSTPGTIKGIHLQELRTALSEARSAIGLSSVTYANGIATGTTPVRATDVNEIRNGVK
jgi:hypothetical protein